MTALSTDIKSVQDTIKEKLQGQIAGLIPDEVWSGMVDQEFRSLTSIRFRYTCPFTGQSVELTKLQYLIQVQLSDYYKAQIKKELDEISLQTRSEYQGGEYLLSNERLETALKAVSGEMISALVVRMFSQSANEVLNHLRNNRF